MTHWKTVRTFAALMLALAGITAGAQSPQAPALDPLPHELHPADWPQPDYFGEAMKLTRLRPGERWRTLKLAPGVEPALLVLPVQMEAFGWTPAFAAIVAARLDHEIAARGFDANRQTDLFDADGPYARRFSDEDIARFAAEHPAQQVLALYVGRDGAGKDFLTLTLRRDGRLLRAHRSFAESGPVGTALDAFSTRFPALLDELGLKADKAPPPAPPRACDAGDWELADAGPGTSRAARACRALAMGVLLPEFGWPTRRFPRIKTADKLPWLAEAWVEADALVPDSADAARTIAWSQFELTLSYEDVATAIDSKDPLARALARALWSPLRARNMPSQDRRANEEQYVRDAAAALPPFVRAVFTERAAFEEQFRPVDLCGLEAELPALRRPPECGEHPPAQRTRVATRGERALLDAWRIAHAVKALRIEGEERGVPERRDAVLRAMPARIAAHPIVRLERFASERFNGATGSFAELVDRAKAATTDFVQTTADLQRLHSALLNIGVSQGQWTSNGSLREVPSIVAVTWDEKHLLDPLFLDGFVSRDGELRMRSDWLARNFLRPEAVAPSGAVVPPGAAMLQSRNRTLEPFPPLLRFAPVQDAASLERASANDPLDLDARTELAVLRLKTGASVAQARALIDARPDDRRADAAIGESHAWARPEFAFFFAGELEAARYYADKVVRLGSYSSSDLQARERLRLIAGDIPGALQATRERFERYGDDFSRRDLAGLEFMRRQPERAWAMLTPRLPASDQLELWTGVAVGQRLDGTSLRAAHDWIVKSDYGHARLRGLDIGALHVLRLATDDRTPDADDLALLASLESSDKSPGATGMEMLQAMAQLKQLAVAPRVDAQALLAVKDVINKTPPMDRGPLRPLYAWAAWRASEGTDPSLATLRTATLADDFDALLAKAVLLGMEKQPDEALRYLRAARFDLVHTIDQGRRDERSAPYTAAFVAWLLHDRTHDPRYRDEALLLARSHQRIFPFLAWPYALDALLSPPGRQRDAAACRAAFLDRGSQFLSLSGLKPDPHAKTCAAFLW
jgi:hypothetical protein